MNEKKWATPLIHQTDRRWRMAIQAPPRLPRVSHNETKNLFFTQFWLSQRSRKMTPKIMKNDSIQKIIYLVVGNGSYDSTDVSLCVLFHTFYRLPYVVFAPQWFMILTAHQITKLFKPLPEMTADYYFILFPGLVSPLIH